MNVNHNSILNFSVYPKNKKVKEEIGWRVWIVIKLKFLINFEIIGEEDNNKKNLYLLARLILVFFFFFLVKIKTQKKNFLREAVFFFFLAVFFLEIKIN